MPEVSLQRAGVVAIVGKLEPATMSELMRMDRVLRPGGGAKAGTIFRKPAVVKGTPRSEVKTNGDVGACSLLRRRSMRSSRPEIGWTEGEPFFTRDTCDWPRLKSTLSQRSATISAAHKPCR